MVWPQEDVDGKKRPFMGVVGQARPPKAIVAANISVVCNHGLK